MTANVYGLRLFLKSRSETAHVEEIIETRCCRTELTGGASVNQICQTISKTRHYTILDKIKTVTETQCYYK